MSRFRRFQVVERRSPAYFLEETTTAIFTPPKTLFPNYPCFPAFPIFEHDLEFPHSAPFFFDEVDTLTDLIQIERAPLRRVTRRIGLGLGLGELQLLALSDRVSDLELGLKRLLLEEKARKKKTKKVEEKKYSWTAEIETAEKHRKYNWTTEIKGGDDEKKSYKWTAQIKGKGVPNERTYTVEVSSGRECAKGEKKKEVKENGKSAARIVEIEQPSDHGAIVLRKAFTKRLEKKKGKSKELSPQDAAALIQMSFRAYLIRRSQALRALRELAIAKTKLKEIRALFNNFSYHRRLSRDAEERQRFSEKIIVLLLTVDAIEGSDSMVRGARRCMVDELEAMLDVVDPQPPGKSRRTTFDMPDGVINKEVADGVINKEVAAGVAKIIEMLHALIGDESNGA